MYIWFVLSPFGRWISSVIPRKRTNSIKIHFKPRTLDESYLASQDTGFLLVIGLPRTGTSLVQQLLNLDKRIFISYESIFQPFLGDNDWQAIHAYFYEVLKQYKHLSFSIHPDLNPNSLKAFSFKSSYSYFGDKVIYRGSAIFRARIQRAIERQQPTKVLFVIRDPRARINSYLRWIEERETEYPRTKGRLSTLDQSNIVEVQSHLWNQFAEDAWNYLSRYSDLCLGIKYEDLVINPRKVLTSIFTYLELNSRDFPFLMLDKVNASAADKWKQELHPDFVQQITSINRENLHLFGYD